MTRPRDGPPLSGSAPRPRARSYALTAALLSQGSPLGALVLLAAIQRQSLTAQLAEHGLLYVYMSLSTLVVFSIFGWVLGGFADDLVRQRRTLRAVNHRLRWLSDVDPLTGILSRRAVHRRLRAELKRAQRETSSLAVLMLDLDHFKNVNDVFGHVAGDRVLRRVGRHLRRLARATDSVGRIGGEEFLVVLPATAPSEAMRFAERLRQAIGARPDDPRTPRVTTSVGVLTVVGPAPSDMEQTLRLADAALYRAKSEGRNRVSLSPASQDAQTAERITGGSASISPERISR